MNYFILQWAFSLLMLLISPCALIIAYYLYIAINNGMKTINKR